MALSESSGETSDQQPPGEHTPGIRLLVVEDDPAVRGAFVALLDAVRGFQVVAQAAEGQQAEALALTHRPDVVILDIRLGQENGVMVGDRIRRSLPRVKLIALTAYDTEGNVYAAARHSFDGYVVKDMAARHLVQAVRTVYRGGQVYLSNTPQALMVQENSLRGVRLAPPYGLTPREMDILGSLAAGKNNRQIADEHGLSVSRIEKLLTSIYDKLEVRGRTEALRRALDEDLAF
jgi:DNA-binding NarL/FixJ family response regulator